jgi:hypothetical protein
VLLSVVPLALGLPAFATVPVLRDAGVLLGVAAASFAGQNLLTHGFQLLPAAAASGVNISQVWRRVSPPGFWLQGMAAVLRASRVR